MLAVTLKHGSHQQISSKSFVRYDYARKLPTWSTGAHTPGHKKLQPLAVDMHVELVDLRITSDNGGFRATSGHVKRYIETEGTTTITQLTLSYAALAGLIRNCSAGIRTGERRHSFEVLSLD